MKQFINNYRIQLILVVVSICLISYGVQFENNKRTLQPHKCSYKLCPFDSTETTFTHGCGDCYQGQDCWVLDSIHFYNPKLNYDGCDSLYTKMVYDVSGFKYIVGDSIFPDYVHGDTMIVRDDRGLNLGLENLMKDLSKGSDADIDSVLNEHCSKIVYRTR